MISESFRRDGPRFCRLLSAGQHARTTFLDCSNSVDPNGSSWDRLVLKGHIPSFESAPRRALTIGELFCGAGGLGFGVGCAMHALGIEPRFSFAVDNDSEALDVYVDNLNPAKRVQANANALIDFALRDHGNAATFAYEPEFVYDNLTAVDVLLAGPPCQGHSNLNNHSRRNDPRNSLYLVVPAVAVASRAKIVIIENVPAIRKDRSGVLETAISVLRDSGYLVDVVDLHADKIGVSQTRKRSFLVASRLAKPNLAEAVIALSRPTPTIGDVIGDLADLVGDSVFDSPPDIDSETRGRIDFLFDNQLHDLPDEQRPICHQNGHTYKSVYGRLYEDRPGYTITQGFQVMGRGRNVHPTRKRTITPHEAARIQGFPDSFRFVPEGHSTSRSALAKLIGNAVPPAMGFVAALAGLATLPER